MPELPEVEIIKLSLEKKILGLNIKDVQILNAKSFMGDVEQIKGAKVIGVWRRAKVLGIDLKQPSLRGVKRRSNLDHTENQDSYGMTLLFHLKMSGQVIFQGTSVKREGESRFVGGHPTHDMLSEMPNKHTRVIFEFEVPESRIESQEKKQNAPRFQTLATSYLYFNDQRKFGWIRLIKNSELRMQNFGYRNEIGPEPLEKEFTWQVLRSNLLKHKKTPVKVAILDSTVIAGIGNIYACEACFLAKIDPKTKVSELGDVQIKNLHQGIVESLQAGIKYGGSTRTHFVDAEGKKGLFLDYCFVYNRNNQPCKVCGTKIEKIKLGSRGTFHCPNCQS